MSIQNIEDCLAFALNHKDFLMRKEDGKVLFSLYRQTNRGVGYTDRQHEMCKRILTKYVDFFAQHSINIDCFNNLKLPLREIDRTHKLSFEEFEGKQWICMRFPFNKKIINCIEDLRKLDSRSEAKYFDKHHMFPIREKYIWELVKIAQRFPTKFEITEEVQNIYNQLEEFEQNAEEHVPGVYNNQIKNMPTVAIDSLKNSVSNKLHLYYDRRHLYGLKFFDQEAVDKELFNLNPLTANIIKRESPNVLVKPSKYSLNELASSINDLERFPILVVLHDTPYIDELMTMYEAFKNIVDPKECSIMFRTSNNKDPHFNEYIKEKQINNPIDKNTKIVYISDNKVTKPVIESNFTPSVLLTFSGVNYMSKVSPFVNGCDLKIEYSEVPSQINLSRTPYETV